jgi:replicative DNA helicase
MKLTDKDYEKYLELAQGAFEVGNYVDAMRLVTDVYRNCENENLKNEAKEKIFEWAKKLAQENQHTEVLNIMEMMPKKDQTTSRLAMEIAKISEKNGRYFTAGMVCAYAGLKQEALKYAKKLAKEGKYFNARLIASEVGAEKEAEEYAKKYRKARKKLK